MTKYYIARTYPSYEYDAKTNSTYFGCIVFIKINSKGRSATRRLIGSNSILTLWTYDVKEKPQDINSWIESGWDVEEITQEYAELLFAMIG